MQRQESCRLYVRIEPGPSAEERLAAALEAADVASCLVAPPAGAAVDARRARALVQLAQRRNVAALIGGDAALARSTGADGVHLLADNAAAAAYAEARRILGPSAVVGADVGISRHDAMLLGEAGADYIAFGAPPHLHDRAKGLARRNDLVAWWAEIFEMPCVAFDVESAAEARELAGLGADFVAITLTPDLSRTAVGAFVADVGAALLPSASVS